MITCPGSASDSFTKSSQRLEQFIKAWRAEAAERGICPTCMLNTLAQSMVREAAQISHDAGDRQIWINAMLILQRAADEMTKNPPALMPAEYKDSTHG